MSRANSQSTVIARVAAQATLEEAYRSDRPALVSVVGRRRVGKTFLVRETYGDRLAFTTTGIANATLRLQLANFALQLQQTFAPRSEPRVFRTWLSALAALSEHLDESFARNEDSRVVFLDELPWLASVKSGFLQAFSWFWNSWAVSRRIVVVICGSAASWMIQKVVRDKGSLHNRITHRITLRPFTLPEFGQFLDSRGITDDPYQRLQLYMALGGVAFYLDLLSPGRSAEQNLQDLLFAEDAKLRGEFDVLYHSLFTQADRHIAVVRALSAKQVGLTRSDLTALIPLNSGGGLTKVLDELELSGFVGASKPFAAKKKQTLYQLIDEYSVFYLKFVEGTEAGANVFSKITRSPSYRSWAGFAFERACLRNVAQITKALGISGIAVTASSYTAKADEDNAGLQIDLLLDRSDRSITIVEAKFSDDVYELTKKYAAELKEKVRLFKRHTRTKKQVFLALVTTYGMKRSPHAVGLIDQVVTMEDLFRPATG